MGRSLLLLACVFAVLALAAAQNTTRWRPVVLMHGLLASASAMSHAQGWIEDALPGIQVINVEIGNGRIDSLFIDMNTQVDLFNEAILNHTDILKDGFNMIGHSQGGMLTRAWIERYNYPPVYNYISWAGPFDGVFGVPDLNALCPDEACPWLLNLWNLVMDGPLTYEVQELLSFASYWKNPLNISDYLANNIFLADINNERPEKTQSYKDHITSLNHMQLEMSSTDLIVVPRESPWFEFYDIGQDTTITQWNETLAYTEDWLGLRTLFESGRLSHVSVPCGHQYIPRTQCESYFRIYNLPLLNNTITTSV